MSQLRLQTRLSSINRPNTLKHNIIQNSLKKVIRTTRSNQNPNFCNGYIPLKQNPNKRTAILGTAIVPGQRRPSNPDICASSINYSSPRYTLDNKSREMWYNRIFRVHQRSQWICIENNYVADQANNGTNIVHGKLCQLSNDSWVKVGRRSSISSVSYRNEPSPLRLPHRHPLSYNIVK